ncbi:MAG: aminotransferase class I/II-fold pyridoxal phosphate-dependent enzyme [Phycisphaerales bacterium]|nr:aminotransferase class I/II-fold pyridoxal phosphate-dependent enzyme [Phycisphaerales bacterium]
MQGMSVEGREVVGGVRLSPRMAGVKPYAPPTGRGTARLLLDANEGAAPGEAVRETLARVDLEQVRRYPEAGVLEALLAERVGVEPERVVVTAGGDDAIHRVCAMTLDAGRTLVTHAPVFEMIPRYARLAGAEVVQVDWLRGGFPHEKLVSTMDGRTGLVAVVSPNNPTGAVAPVRDLVAVAQAALRRGVVAMIDLAYAEFAQVDPTPALIELPNVVMIRTLSKAFGLAGLRVGYAVCPRELAPMARAAGGPYPVSGLSLAVGEAMVRKWDVAETWMQGVREERERLGAVLREVGARPMESQANFVTAEFVDAGGVHAGLLRRGISVRAFGGMMERFLRFTLPGEVGAFDELVSALRAVCEEVGR